MSECVYRRLWGPQGLKTEENLKNRSFESNFSPRGLGFSKKYVLHPLVRYVLLWILKKSMCETAVAAQEVQKSKPPKLKKREKQRKKAHFCS